MATMHERVRWPAPACLGSDTLQKIRTQQPVTPPQESDFSKMTEVPKVSTMVFSASLALAFYPVSDIRLNYRECSPLG